MALKIYITTYLVIECEDGIELLRVQLDTL